MEVNSIYSSKMFPLTRHMRSAGLNVYNSAQLSDKIANIISKEQNNSIGCICLISILIKKPIVFFLQLVFLFL